MVGKTVSHYRILEKLGAGGMGVVYRARDERLKRDVALKVLPEAVARDTERMARFEREAQVLASLNHPNIASIYGLEESEGIRALLMELVEGPTLAERLKSGAMPIEEALPIARQIAEALEAAHERGIIHRDLKPANVKVTPDGTVKVLDFGLAKALESEGPTTNISDSPTLSSAATEAGVILGTAAYMSPEQARGKAVDKRADVWAFGCVLYEMLTGKKVFEGETISDVLAAVIRADPDWAALPTNTPLRIRELVRRCLQKEPKQRLRDIGDARIVIEEFLSNPGAEPQSGAVSAAVFRLGWLPWGFATASTLALVVVALVLWRGRERLPPYATRVTVTVPAAQALDVSQDDQAVALSPDGAKLVYVASQTGPPQLYLRPLDQAEATPIRGTDGASGPFFSPDGRWVGFFAGGKLKKVPVEGGVPVALSDAARNRGATWTPNDTIIFSPAPTAGLSFVSAAGGTPQVLTTPDGSKGERTHRWPQVLPGGKAILFTVGQLNRPANFDEAQVAVQSLETGERHVVIEGAGMARYVPTSGSHGHLAYAHAGSLFAVPFDLKHLKVSGMAVPAVQGVMEFTESGLAEFALSDQGSLVYLPGSRAESLSDLVWIDRKGSLQVIPSPRRPYLRPRLSPDGKRVALNISSGGASMEGDIWIYDLVRSTLARLTFTSNNNNPVWTPDGKRVAFVSVAKSGYGIFWKLADGSGPTELLLTIPPLSLRPDSFSPDGRFLALTETGRGKLDDLWILPLIGERQPRPYLETEFDEGRASFSPDGRWLAYESDESGQWQVYVQPFPGPGGRWQASSGGGRYPRWAHSGRELFYQDRNMMMAVPVETQPSFSAGTPRVLFESQLPLSPLSAPCFDVSPDGQRFLVVKANQEASAPAQISLVLNWFEELRRLARADRK